MNEFTYGDICIIKNENATDVVPEEDLRNIKELRRPDGFIDSEKMEEYIVVYYTGIKNVTNSDWSYYYVMPYFNEDRDKIPSRLVICTALHFISAPSKAEEDNLDKMRQSGAMSTIYKYANPIDKIPIAQRKPSKLLRNGDLCIVNHNVKLDDGEPVDSNMGATGNFVVIIEARYDDQEEEFIYRVIGYNGATIYNYGPFKDGDLDFIMSLPPDRLYDSIEKYEDRRDRNE